MKRPTQEDKMKQRYPRMRRKERSLDERYEECEKEKEITLNSESEITTELYIFLSLTSDDTRVREKARRMPLQLLPQRKRESFLGMQINSDYY